MMGTLIRLKVQEMFPEIQVMVTAYWAQFLSKGIKILLVARRDFF